MGYFDPPILQIVNRSSLFHSYTLARLERYVLTPFTDPDQALHPTLWRSPHSLP